MEESSLFRRNIYAFVFVHITPLEWIINLLTISMPLAKHLAFGEG